jgi:hypothetical protein
MSLVTLREKIDSITAAIHSGEIERMQRSELVKFNSWLCNDIASTYFSGGYAETCETVRFHMLRSVIDGLEERSRRTEFWVIALAVAALISSIVQIFSPVLLPTPPTVTTQPAPVVQLTCPTAAALQAPCPTAKKKP